MHTLSPTPRTTATRSAHRTVADPERLRALLDGALVAHLGVTITTQSAGHASTHPVVLPVVYAVDRDGPDEGGTLYLHGSSGAGWLQAALSSDVCVTVTELDGLVVARSAFHHSMNYRSAVVIGRPRLVEDHDEKARALALVVDHMVPGRSATMRPSTRKEVAATAVLALPLAEASMKERTGGPLDDEDDIASGVWGGHVPVRRVADAPVSAPDSHDDVPPEVRQLADQLA